MQKRKHAVRRELKYQQSLEALKQKVTGFSGVEKSVEREVSAEGMKD